MAKSNLSNVIPIQYIGEDYILTANGDISFVYELNLPEIFSVDEYGYNDLHRKISNVIGGSNDNVVFHFLNMIYTDKYETDLIVSNYTNKKDNEHFLGRAQLRNKNYLIISFPTLIGNYYPSHTSTSFIKSIDVIKSDLFEKIQNNSRGVRQELITLENELKGNSLIKIKRLYKNDIAEFIYNTYNATFDKWEKIDSIHSLFNPIEVTSEYLRIGTDYIGVCTFANEPIRVSTFENVQTLDSEVFNSGIVFKNNFGVPTSAGYGITIGMPIKHIVNTIIQKRSPVSVKEQLTKENLGLSFLRGIGSKDAQRKENEIDLYLNEITKENPCTFSQSIWVYGETPKELNKNLGLARSCYKTVGSGVESFIENKQTANLYFSTMPGIARENFMYHFSYTAKSSCFIPMEGLFNNDPKGFRFVDLFGNIIVINLTNLYSNNPNKLVFGPSGTGKSVLLNNYISQCYDKYYHCIVLEVGGSFKSNTEVNGGKFIDCGVKSNMQFNIFNTTRDKNGCYLYLSKDLDDEENINKVAFIYVIISKILYGKKQDVLETVEAKRIFEKSIIEYYEYVNSQILKTNNRDIEMSLTGYVRFFNQYYDILKKKGFSEFINISSFNLLIEPYVENGEKAYLLNGKENFDITMDRFVSFDVQSIQKDETLLSIVSTIIVEMVEIKLAELPLYIRKVFVIDEALDFLKGPLMGEFISGMYRKIRKRGGEVIIATQDAKFLDACDQLVKDSIFSNADYKIVLGLPSEESKRDATRLMGLVEKELELICGLKPKREFFLKICNKPMLLKNEISLHTLTTYTTDPDELGKIKEYQKKYDSSIGGINNYVQDKIDKKI